MPFLDNQRDANRRQYWSIWKSCACFGCSAGSWNRKGFWRQFNHISQRKECMWNKIKAHQFYAFFSIHFFKRETTGTRNRTENIQTTEIEDQITLFVPPRQRLRIYRIAIYCNETTNTVEMYSEGIKIYTVYDVYNVVPAPMYATFITYFCMHFKFDLNHFTFHSFRFCLYFASNYEWIKCFIENRTYAKL